MILDGPEAWEAILDELKAVNDSDIYIVSAFIRHEALSKLTEHVNAGNRIHIGARWAAKDLLDGASDIKSCKLALDQKWNFYSIKDLHAKAYLLGQRALYSGSANLTNRGFGLVEHLGNKEIITRSSTSESNVKKIKGLFKNAIQIDKKLFNEIKNWLEAQENQTSSELVGSYPIEHQPLVDLSNGIMVADCLTMNPTEILLSENDPSDQINSHNLELLNIRAKEINSSSLGISFMSTLLFLWLKNELENEEERTLYFGALSNKLHQTLKDDPSPRRREIKDLLAILLRWVEYVPSCGIQVDRPNHSERVQLIKS